MVASVFKAAAMYGRTKTIQLLLQRNVISQDMLNEALITAATKKCGDIVRTVTQLYY
jgi:hypothetical protein